jgi:flagella synthesis protein FlgN
MNGNLNHALNNPVNAQQNAQTPPLQVIQTLIHNEQHNVAQLTALLEQEQHCLEQREGKKLEALLSQKKQLLTMLAQNGISRQTILKQNNRKDSPDNWRNLLEQLDHQHGLNLRPAWASVETALRECKKKNDTNGMIIKRSQVSLGHVLDIMRGKIGQPKLYNQRGYAGSGNSASRSIGTA